LDQQGDVACTQEAQGFFFLLRRVGEGLDFLVFSFPNVFPNMFPIGGRGWARGGLGRHPHLINAKIKIKKVPSKFVYGKKAPQSYSH
jgi:hypothetical protein